MIFPVNQEKNNINNTTYHPAKKGINGITGITYFASVLPILPLEILKLNFSSPLPSLLGEKTNFLPKTVMDFAEAEKNKTDKERIDEYDGTFGESKIHEGKKPTDDGRIDQYNPITELPDHVKVDVIKSLDKAKNTPRSQVDIDFEKEQVKVHKTVKALMELIDETEDVELKAILENTLNDMKSRMAEAGIFLHEDKGNRELRDIFKKAYKAKQDKATVKGVVYDALTNSYIQPVSHTYNWDVDVYVDYTCEPVTCSIGPGVWETDGGGSIISHSGTISNDISTLNFIEFFVLMDSNYHGWAYQGTYHQGIHYDSDWNYLSGSSPTYNLWYTPGGSHLINPHNAVNGNAGDKVYSYLYIN